MERDGRGGLERSRPAPVESGGCLMCACLPLPQKPLLGVRGGEGQQRLALLLSHREVHLQPQLLEPFVALNLQVLNSAQMSNSRTAGQSTSIAPVTICRFL